MLAQILHARFGEFAIGGLFTHEAFMGATCTAAERAPGREFSPGSSSEATLTS